MKKSKLKKYNVHYIVSCMHMLTESLCLIIMFQRRNKCWKAGQALHRERSRIQPIHFSVVIDQITSSNK